MTTRAELVAQWQARLAASESQLASGASRQWLWEMRVRLYRFLLLCYGSGQWEADEPGIPEPAHSRQLVDNRASAVGLAPKSAERIRATLKSVRAANDREDEQGPYADGSYRLEWIRVASYKHLAESKALVKGLKASGIASRSERNGRQHVVEVQRINFDAALECLAQMRPQIATARATSVAQRIAIVYAVQAAFFALLALALFCGPAVQLLYRAFAGLTVDVTTTQVVLAGCGLGCLAMTAVTLFELWRFLQRVRVSPLSDPTYVSSLRSQI